MPQKAQKSDEANLLSYETKDIGFYELLLSSCTQSWIGHSGLMQHSPAFLIKGKVVQTEAVSLELREEWGGSIIKAQLLPDFLLADCKIE